MLRKRFGMLVMSVLVLTGTATAVPLVISGGVAGASATTQFTTPGCSVYTVPPSVTQIQVDAYGAQGGSNPPPSSMSGGLGGHAGGLLNVSPGQQLDVCVGGQGNGSTPGFNGGGTVQSGATGQPAGQRGGGASDVRTGSFGLGERVLVAGGGGGSGVLPGGAGGGTSGTDCTTSGDPSSPYCGAGGSQTGGGAGGTEAQSITGGLPGNAGILASEEAAAPRLVGHQVYLSIPVVVAAGATSVVAEARSVPAAEVRASWRHRYRQPGLG